MFNFDSVLSLNLGPSMTQSSSNDALRLKDPDGLDLDNDQTKLLCYGYIKEWTKKQADEWNANQLFSNIPMYLQEIIVKYLQENDEFTVADNYKQITNNGKSFCDLGLFQIPRTHSKGYRGVEYQLRIF